MKKKEPTFEEGLARLEELVSALEDRALSLDKALAAFEEGLTLSAALRHKLDEAAGKVEILTRNQAGGLDSQPFNDDDFDGTARDDENG